MLVNIHLYVNMCMLMIYKKISVYKSPHPQDVIVSGIVQIPEIFAKNKNKNKIDAEKTRP